MDLLEFESHLSPFRMLDGRAIRWAGIGLARSIDRVLFNISHRHNSADTNGGLIYWLDNCGPERYDGALKIGLATTVFRAQVGRVSVRRVDGEIEFVWVCSVIRADH